MDQTRLCANSMQTSQVSLLCCTLVTSLVEDRSFSTGCTGKLLSLLPSDIFPVCMVFTEPVGQFLSRLSHQRPTSRVALASGKKNPQWSSRTRKLLSASELKGVFSNDRNPEYRRVIRKDLCMAKQTL